jgi:hypothetical protein
LSPREVRDVAASVRQRLLNRAHERGEDFQLVLTWYGIERLLYRLAQSAHVESFVLEGAMLFSIWSDEAYRPTRDLDLLGLGDGQHDDVDPNRRGAAMEYDTDRIDDAVLALLHLTSFESHGARRAWMSHDWDALGRSAGCTRRGGSAIRSARRSPSS